MVNSGRLIMTDTLVATKSKRVVCESSLKPSTEPAGSRVPCFDCGGLVHIKLNGLQRRHPRKKKK